MTRILRQVTRCAGPATLFTPALRTFSTTPAINATAAAINIVSPTQPPSARPPAERKTQVIRSYTNLLRTTPLLIFFQHNNITAQEWATIRRELNLKLRSVGAVDVGEPDGQPVDLAPFIRLQVVRSRMMDVAMRIVEFHKKGDPLTHDLSERAYRTITKVAKNGAPEGSQHAALAPILTGPIAVLSIPAVSPAFLAAALSILAPSPAFPAPTRRAAPGLYEPATQNALAKLILMGGRVENQVFDNSGVAWVGGISGGVSGLRAQVVHLLQSAGMGLASTLQGASKALYVSLESHRQNLEPKEEKEEQKEGGEEKKE